MGRDHLIQQLLVETLHQIVEQGRTGWLLGILEHGFAGYANLSDKDLEAAARRFGIVTANTARDDFAPVGNDDDTDDHAAELSFATRYVGVPGSLIGNLALDSE